MLFKKFKLNIFKTDIIIIDDIFPFELSGFRYQEFSSILKHFNKSKVLTTGESLFLFKNDGIKNIISKYIKKYPSFQDKVQIFTDKSDVKCRLLYCVFLNNAYNYLLKISDKYNIPFVFTLYPGGGFGLNNKESDNKLKQIFKSKNFKKVIVTQTITYNYLLNNNFCPENKIKLIFGGVMPIRKSRNKILNKKYYKNGKNSFDVCFVAYRYTKYGEEKGYDIFLDVAKILSKKYNNIYFHVVGQFDENILDIKGIKNIKFYGNRNQKWFDKFYLNKDLIVAPNLNGKIYDGGFDGFPTGCVIDAANRKVAMFCTDPLNLNNNRFIENKEIVIIEHNANDIVNKIEYYISNPQKLKILSINGYKKVKFLYGYKKQIKPRLELLSKIAKGSFLYNILHLLKK